MNQYLADIYLYSVVVRESPSDFRLIQVLLHVCMILSRNSKWIYYVDTICFRKWNKLKKNSRGNARQGASLFCEEWWSIDPKKTPKQTNKRTSSVSSSLSTLPFLKLPPSRSGWSFSAFSFNTVEKNIDRVEELKFIIWERFSSTAVRKPAHYS